MKRVGFFLRKTKVFKLKFFVFRCGVNCCTRLT